MTPNSFASEECMQAYLEHVRTCKGHHDPRGVKYSRCGKLNPNWFAGDICDSA